MNDLTKTCIGNYSMDNRTIKDWRGDVFVADQLDETAFMTNGLGDFVHEADYVAWLKREIERMDEQQLQATMKQLFGWRMMNEGNY